MSCTGAPCCPDASLREMTDFGGEWYGLGVMDLSSEYGALAVGHEDQFRRYLLLLDPSRGAAGEGLVISVQANTEATDQPYDTYNHELVRLTEVLRDAARG